MTPGRTILAFGWLAVVMAGCARSVAVPGMEGRMPRQDLVHADPLEEGDDYDPWQRFNEPMFSFNHYILDRYIVKPTAEGWEKVMPEAARRSVSRLFDNLDMPPRFVNSLLQARPLGAGRELARFALNSTVGLAGLLDVATPLHIQRSDADAGETLALYGVGAGPYLVLPTMAPGTVRDAIGRGIDGFLSPLSIVLPFVAGRVTSVVKTVNERSLNLRLFANVEDTTLDLYSAARNGYLQRRQRAIQVAIEDRAREWGRFEAPTVLVAADSPEPGPVKESDVTTAIPPVRLSGLSKNEVRD